GAMLAGMVLRAWTRRLNIDTTGLEHKFDAVGYGIFIPIFFVSSGMTLDLKAISQDPLRLLIFFALLLIVRGLPSLLVYRRALPARQRVEMTFITATTLPLLIALAEIGHRDRPATGESRPAWSKRSRIFGSRRLRPLHMLAMSLSTRSSTERNGSLHSTVRWAWSFSFRCTQSTVKSRRFSCARRMNSPRSLARVVCGGTDLASQMSLSRAARSTAPARCSR